MKVYVSTGMSEKLQNNTVSESWDINLMDFSAPFCSACGQPIPNEGFIHDGRRYCSSHCAHKSGVYSLFDYALRNAD